MTSLTVAGRTIETSSLDKPYFPGDGITKGEVLDYYRRVAPTMAPHLEGRPLVLQRFPDGIEGAGFYHKHAADHFPDWMRTASLPRRQGGVVRHVLGDDEATIVHLANFGTITFHVWPTRADRVEHPDLLVFDLDPDETTPLDVIRAAARAVRDRLGDVGLTPYLQTSGSRGYHVVAPLDRRAEFDAARRFSRALADSVAADEPELFTTAQRRADRGDRVFLDTNRNAYAQHIAAPYTVRARPGAPVATPIDWGELGRVEPRTYTIRNLFRRLGQKADPWAGIADDSGSLGDAVRRLEARR